MKIRLPAAVCASRAFRLVVARKLSARGKRAKETAYVFGAIRAVCRGDDSFPEVAWVGQNATEAVRTGPQRHCHDTAKPHFLLPGFGALTIIYGL